MIVYLDKAIKPLIMPKMSWLVKTFKVKAGVIKDKDNKLMLFSVPDESYWKDI